MPPKSRINIYHLKEAKLEMATNLSATSDKSISENYGIHDMYADANHPDRNHIEKKLSVLESQAADVIRLLVDAGKTNAPAPVSLKRKELNTLRKFLFLMTYRNSHRAEQFLTNRFDPQTRADVRKHIVDNMDNPQATSRDVWLQNIREVLDTKVWEIPENKKILLQDRRFYTQEMRSYRLAIWQSPPDEEFIMCDTGFGFYDGSTLFCNSELRGFLRNAPYNAPHRGKVDPNEPIHPDLDPNSIAGNPLHTWVRIFPISPRLVLVLASKVLDQESAETLEIFLRMGPHSRFHNFPYLKPQTEYRNLTAAGRDALARGDFETLTGGSENTARIVQGLLEGHPAPYGLLDGRILESRETDVFRFPIALLSDQQVNLVNGLVLENATNQLTFRSPQKLLQYIAAYEEEQVWNKCPSHIDLKKTLETELSVLGAATPACVVPTLSRSIPMSPSQPVARPLASADVTVAPECPPVPAACLQYHPRIPFFILKHFEASRASLRKLTTADGPFTSTPRADRSCLMHNMYQTESEELNLGVNFCAGNHYSRSCDPTSQHSEFERVHPTRLHEKFSNLESAAADILAPVIDAAETGIGSVMILRRDLNILSKFLFFWGYRNNTLAENRSMFWENMLDSSTRYKLYAKLADKRTVKKYYGLEQWMLSLNALLGANVWDIPFNIRLFDEDRVEFMRDVRRRRPVFWRAADDEEFVISDNRFGFTDGIGFPTDFATAAFFDVPFSVPWLPPVDAAGIRNGCIQVSFRIYPLSPKLVVVLADKILVDEEHRAMRHARTKLFPGSRLLDFPFPKPDVDYMNVSEAGREKMEQNAGVPADKKYVAEAERLRTIGGLVLPPLIDGKLAESRESDRLHFPIVKLTRKQTEIINGLAIRNAQGCLVFHSPKRLLRYVEEYEKNPIPSDLRDYTPLKQALDECIEPSNHTHVTKARPGETLWNGNVAKAWLQRL